MGNKTGRPPYEPQDKDRPVVQALVANGLTQQQIAHYLRIDFKTLTKHFPEELSNGYDNVLSIISGRLVQKAMSGDNACMIFWLKSRARWQERHEITGANGEPLFGGVTDSRLTEIIDQLRESFPPTASGDGKPAEGHTETPLEPDPE